MRFKEAYEGCIEGRLTQGEAARILGMCERSFRRYLVRYEAEGLEGLIDRRLEQISNRRAPEDEVMALTDRYRNQHRGWNIEHFTRRRHPQLQLGQKSFARSQTRTQGEETRHPSVTLAGIAIQKAEYLSALMSKSTLLRRR